MIGIKLFQSALRCPNCHYSPITNTSSDSELSCESCHSKFPLSYNRPVLLRSDNELFNIDSYRNAPVVTHKNSGIERFIPSSSVNLSFHDTIRLMREMLIENPVSNVLVVGGGRQRAVLNRLLGSEKITIIYSDIDINSDVDLFCDGHELPFKDETFDAVVTTAVLEHVIYPERVVAEIRRVLKVNGKLYSELPFIQQVHEGAYDFTRYTYSGHRRLLNGFQEIKGGMVAGPGTALVWTIENFVLAFISTPFLRKIGKALVRIIFFWIKYFDLILKNKAEAVDGASCTYFFGSKIPGMIPDSTIVNSYVGAKHLSHT